MPVSPRPRRSPLAPWRWPLHWQILLALVAGVAAGLGGRLPQVKIPYQLSRPAAVRISVQDEHGTTVRVLLDSDLPAGAGTVTWNGLGTGDKPAAPGSFRAVIQTPAGTETRGIQLPDRRWFRLLWPFSLFNFFGTLFLRALRMVIVPLLAGSIITGVAGVGSARSLGRLLRKTFGWYILTSLVAILTGLLLVNLLQPGFRDGEPVGHRLGLQVSTQELAPALGDRGPGDLVQISQRMIPENPVAAAAEGQMLPLIFFCLLFGVGLTLLPAQHRASQVSFWEGLFAVMMQITGWVIRLAPVGIWALMAKIVAVSGFEAFPPLARYGLTVLLALVTHAVVTLPLLFFLLSRLRPDRQARVMAPALMTAFSTRSSSATLPVTLDRIEHGAGVSNRVCSFVLPLGATVNMDGTALYECVAALFIAQAYGISLGIVEQGIIVVTALLASIGAAGIPAAGLVMISIVLEAVGLPLEGVALILAIDPVLDMCRTAVNVWSDSCGAVVIAASEGESGLLAAGANYRRPAAGRSAP